MLNYRFKTDSNSENCDMDFKLYYCGKESCSSGHSWGPGMKDHYKIHYIYGGKGTFEINDRIYHLEGGQGFLISPSTKAKYKADDKNPWTYAWVAFDGRYAESYLNSTGLSQDFPVFSCGNNESVQNCLEQLFKACTDPITNELHLLSSLYLLLALIKDCTSNSYKKMSFKPKDFYIQTALEYIRTNYSRSLCIQDMSQYLSLNRNYLTRIFKESTGMTPQSYLINYRIDKACSLMRDSYLTIGEISNSVGYRDQLLFSRMFKKTMGMSPRDYREGL